MGVIGMSLADQDQVIEMQQADDEQSLMIVSKKGLGKCTLTTEFTTQKRGGKGVKCYKILEKTGNLVGVQSVGKEDEMMLITTEGTVIQIKVADTALSGRVTSGVKLINLNDGVEVASIAKVRRDENMDTDEDVIENEEELEETTDNNSEAQVSTVQEDN
jgi:DNA gyrase subunit A